MAESGEGTESLRQRWARTLGSDPDSTDYAPGSTYKPPAGKPLWAEPEPPLPPGAPEFVALEELGRGGMGVVFRASQASLQRIVALKTLKESVEIGGARRQQFLSEARLTGRLEHPNIVPVHALNAGALGEPLLAMKLVNGQPWNKLLKAGDYDDREQLEVLIQVCNAVAYAHDQGVLHCDLKPGNVMLGQFGEVMVMDWGLAVGFQEKTPGLRHISDVDAPCGTPAYMPPELAEGEGGRLGPWSDVFMLGGILYRILTGRPPHTGKTLFQVVLAASKGVVEPLSEDHPAGLRELCARALEPDLERRFQSVADFLHDLRAHLVHRESLAIRTAADQKLADCKLRASSGALLAEEARDRLYEEFAEAVAGFGNALQLWEHPQAREGAARARLAFASAAIIQGDLGLARAQLARVDADAAPASQIAEVRGFLEQRQSQRFDEQRSRRWLQRALLAAGLLILGLVGAAWLQASFRQQRLTTTRQRALDTLGFARATYVEALADVRSRLAVLADAPQRGSEGAGVLAPHAPLSAESRRLNREAVLELLAGVRREQQLLRLATEPVDGKLHEFFAPGTLQMRGERLQEALEGAFELAIRCDAWDMSQMVALSMEQKLQGPFIERVRAGREQQLKVQLLRTERALDDLRRGREREGRPSWGPTPQEIIVELSAYRRPEVVAVLEAALQPYLERMRTEQAPIWSQAEREELEVILRVLGHLELAAYTVPVLCRCVELVRDPELTVIAAEALCMTRDPAANEVLLSQVRDLHGIESQIWGQVKRVFGRVPLSEPDAVFVEARDYFNRALTRDHKGDLLGALADYDAALRLRPDYVVAIGNRATLLSKLKRHEEALDGLGRVIELCPESVASYVNRGCTYLQLGRWQEGLADFELALELQPGMAQAHNNRGLIFFELEDYRSAIDEFSAALRSEPTMLQALLNRGDAYFELGDWQEAGDDWTRLIDLDPGDARARSRLGQLLLKVGSVERALRVLSEAIVLEPGYPQPYYERGAAFFKLGRFHECIQDLSVFLEYDASQPIAWKNRGNAWARLGEHDAALADYGRAIELREDFLALYRRAFVWLQLKEYVAAIEDMDRVLKTRCQYDMSEAQIAEIRKSAAELAATLCGRMVLEATESGTRDVWVERAFGFLEQRFALAGVDVEQLLEQPEFEPLHTDPRWQALLERQ